MNAPAHLDPKRIWRWMLQGVALGAVATVAVFIFTVRSDTWAQLRRFDLSWLPLMGMLVAIAWTCNGARVWLLCRAIGHRLTFRQSLHVTMSQEFAVAVTPAGVGSAVVRFALLARAGIPVASSASMLTTDIAIDLLFFALLAPVAVIVVLRDPAFGGLLARLGNRPPLAPLLLALAGLIVVVLLLRSASFHRWVERRAGASGFGRRRRLPGRHRYLRVRTARALRRMRLSLALLWGRRKAALLLSFLFAAVQWSCRYSLLPLVLLAAHAPVNPLPLFLAQGLLFMLSMLVVAPGGGGAVELLAALVLPAFVPVSLIGVIVLIWRLCTYHLYILGGGAVFFYTMRHLDALFPPLSAAAPAETKPPAAP